MDYTILTDEQRRQILTQHLNQHEADHFNATLNLRKATNAADAENATAWEKTAKRAEADAAYTRKRLDELDEPQVPPE